MNSIITGISISLLGIIVVIARKEIVKPILFFRFQDPNNQENINSGKLFFLIFGILIVLLGIAIMLKLIQFKY